MRGRGGARGRLKKKGAENAGNKTWQNEQNTSQVGEGDTRIIRKSEDKRKRKQALLEINQKEIHFYIH